MESLQKLWRQTRLYGLMVPAAPLTTLAMMYFLGMRGFQPTEEPQEALKLILPVVALIEVPVIFLIRKMMLGGFAMTGPEEYVVRNAEPVDREDAIGALRAAVSKYFRATNVGGALGFSIAMYGFVLMLLFGEFLWAVPFVALSSVVLLVQVPRWPCVLSIVPPGVVKTARQERLEP